MTNLTRLSHEDEKNPPASTKDYIFCSSCGFEQWIGYSTCQKCGTVFEKNSKG